MDQDETLGGVCCIIAYCYENLCKKNEIIEEGNYNEIV